MPDKTGKIVEGIDLLYDKSIEALFPNELDDFMRGFSQEVTTSRHVSADSKYWGERIKYVQDRLRLAEVARRGVAGVAVDAAKVIEERRYIELPPDQQAYLGELASRVIKED